MEHYVRWPPVTLVLICRELADKWAFYDNAGEARRLLEQGP